MYFFAFSFIITRLEQRKNTLSISSYQQFAIECLTNPTHHFAIEYLTNPTHHFAIECLTNPTHHFAIECLTNPNSPLCH